MFTAVPVGSPVFIPRVHCPISGGPSPFTLGVVACFWGWRGTLMADEAPPSLHNQSFIPCFLPQAPCKAETSSRHGASGPGVVVAGLVPRLGGEDQGGCIPAWCKCWELPKPPHQVSGKCTPGLNHVKTRLAGAGISGSTMAIFFLVFIS